MFNENKSKEINAYIILMWFIKCWWFNQIPYEQLLLLFIVGEATNKIVTYYFEAQK